MTQTLVVSTRSRSYAEANMAPNNIPLVRTKTIQDRFEQSRGHRPNVKDLTGVLVGAVLELEAHREERRNCRDMQRRFELTVLIEGILNDICELMKLATVKKSAARSLLKEYAHPARALLLEESCESEQRLRIKHFDADRAKERRTLAGFYGAKRDRLLALERQISRDEEELSPDQRLELAVCMHRFAALKERQGDRLRAEPMVEGALRYARSLNPQYYGLFKEQIENQPGLDLSKKH